MIVKKRTFAGVVCEQEIFTVPDRLQNLRKAEPRQRFATNDDREQHKLNISRRNHIRLFNTNFSHTSLYSTLTFDGEHECDDYMTAKHIRDLYIRRLKYAYPDAVVFAYIGRGKKSHRIHIHLVSEGVPEDVINAKWVYGRIKRIEHLRAHNYYNGVDHGQDYTGLANYLFDHWSSEQGGHRWRQTRNARKPDRETPTITKRRYTVDKPPQAPKGYKLVDIKCTKYGYLYFKYVLVVQDNDDGMQKGAG